MSTPFFKKYDTEHHTCLLQNLKWIHSRFSFPHAFRGYLEPKSLVSHRTCSLCRTPKEIAASTAYTRNDTCLTQNCLVPDDCGQYHIASQFWNFTFLVPIADIEIYGRKHDLHQKPFKDVTQDLVDVVLQIHNDAKGGVELGKYRDSRIDEKLRKRYKLLKEDGMNGPPDQVIAHQALLHFLGASICEECLALDAGKDAIVEVASVLNLLGNLCCKKDQFGDGLKRILVNRFQSPRLAANWKINYGSKDKKTVESISESATSNEHRPVRSSSRLRKRHRGPAEEEDVRSEDPEMIAKDGSKTAHITASEPDENPEHFEEILKPARTLKNPFAQKDLHHANGSDRDRDAEISDEHNELGNPIFPTNRSKMSAPNTKSQRNSQGKQSWLNDLEEFNSRVDSTCQSMDRFTPAEFQGHFGFVEPMNYGYKSLEDLFVMRGCVHEGGAAFSYKGITCPIQPSSANGNEVFEYPKIPSNVPLGRLIQYYSHVDGVMRQLKQFSISEFEEKFDPKAHENYGFYSVEHVLSFRGCQRTGEEFVFDEVTALQTKALSVATYLNMEFSELEFKRVFRRLFLTNNVTVHLAKRGFDSLRSLLKSLGGVEINKFGDDKGYVKYTLLTSRRESQGPSLTDVQATANTIPVPSDVVENDLNDSDIGIPHEHILTKKRALSADDEEAVFDGDGAPILKKEKKCPQESSPMPTETFAEEVSNADSNDVFCPDEDMKLKRKKNPEGRQENEKSSKDTTASEEANSVDEEEIDKQERVVIEEADSTVESVPIPTDPSEANSVYEHILNMGTPCGQWVEKQASEITAQMDQSVQKEGAMGGSGDSGAGCSTSQPSEAAFVDSDDEALIEVMSYHNVFLNSVILGAMKKGVDPEDLGKKVLDRIFEKNPEP